MGGRQQGSSVPALPLKGFPFSGPGLLSAGRAGLPRPLPLPHTLEASELHP